MQGRRQARLQTVPSYGDQALCQGQRLESDIRKDRQPAGRAAGWGWGWGCSGVDWRRQQGSGGCGGPAGVGAGGTATSRARCWAGVTPGCRGGHSLQQPARLPQKTLLLSCLITTCQSRFPSSLTCLPIFPNKEGSYKHGNHLRWQRQTAARTRARPSPRRGSRGGGGSRSWQSSVPIQSSCRSPSLPLHGL